MRALGLSLLAAAKAVAAPISVIVTFVLFALISQDTFIRADGTLRANWTTIAGYSALKIASNSVEIVSTAGADARAYYNVNPPGGWPKNQWSSATITTLNNSSSVAEIAIRTATSAQTLYSLRVQGPLGASATVRLVKLVSGAVTTLAGPTTTTVNSGDIAMLSVVGTTITGYIHGASVITSSDSAITAGNPGIGIEANGQAIGDVVMGQWNGGQVNANPLVAGPGYLSGAFNQMSFQGLSVPTNTSVFSCGYQIQGTDW